MSDVIEVAKTGRASCRTCRQAIAKGELRFGEEEPNAFSESGGTSLRWHHLACAAQARPQKLRPVLDAYTGDVPDRAGLIAKMEGAASKMKPSFPYAELAPTGRSKCMQCNENIEKGALRVAVEREVDTGSFVTKGAGYLHPACSLDTEHGEDEHFFETVLRNSRLDADARAKLEEEFGA